MSTTQAIYTAAQVAQQIGATDRTVRRLANQHCVGAALGSRRVFCDADIDRLKSLFRGKSGNPNFVAGNEFGKIPKKKRKKTTKAIDRKRSIGIIHPSQSR